MKRSGLQSESCGIRSTVIFRPADSLKLWRRAFWLRARIIAKVFGHSARNESRNSKGRKATKHKGQKEHKGQKKVTKPRQDLCPLRPLGPLSPFCFTGRRNVI